MSGRFLPPDHSRGDANTIGGYTAVHARPAAFDWPWIVYYAWRYLGENPFGFKAVCASSWFLALGKPFDVELPHVAVKDAEIQLAHFLSHMARSS